MVFIKLSRPSNLISPAHLMYCNFTLLDSTALSWCWSNPHMGCSAFSPLFSSFNSYSRFQLRYCPLDNLSKTQIQLSTLSSLISAYIAQVHSSYSKSIFLPAKPLLFMLQEDRECSYMVCISNTLAEFLHIFLFKFWWERKIDLVITCGVDCSMPDHLTDQPMDSLALDWVPISGSVKGSPLLKEHLPPLEDYGCWSLLNNGWWAC